ncbi:energy-coupling factor transporter transmembrane component T family protein [Diaminobutyricibacter sp. McL0618]|uniref:energy-coupling factor transporter transmembrane component T family protein n=1 Tax=Leifsonia sp. McL0618 TaxID=3415677 RepID=UPI003CF0BAEA
MIPVHVEGSSMVHRMPAGAKLSVMVVVVALISLTPNGPLLAGWGILVVVGYALAGLLRSQLFRQVYLMRWIIVITVVGQLVFVGETAAVLNTLRIVILILAAALVSLTTRVSDMLETVERFVGRFRRFGANPEAVGTVLMVAITSIPVIASHAGRVREAYRARRAGTNIPAMTSTMLVLAIKHADELGDALVARGGHAGSRR